RGRNSPMNGRRSRRAKKPIASARKWREWRAIRTLSVAWKWRATRGNSIRANKDQLDSFGPNLSWGLGAWGITEIGAVLPGGAAAIKNGKGVEIVNISSN